MVSGRGQNPVFKGVHGILATASASWGLRANADTPEDAAKARSFVPRVSACSAPNICSTAPVRLNRCSNCEDDSRGQRRGNPRKAAVDELFPHVKADIQATLEAMDGFPGDDPPARSAVAPVAAHSGGRCRRLAESLNISLEELAKRAEGLHEVNPMMGHRGVRLGVTYPEAQPNISAPSSKRRRS